jgi:ATP-dependent DNA helicase
MQKLNKEQEQAVTTTEGYLRVISGAGTGKTRVITNRYINLVNNLGVANGNILCITFTNNASREMKRRIDKMIKDKDVGYICTFHSLSSKALREDIHCLGIVPNFQIIDKEDQKEIFKDIYKKLGITNKQCLYETLREHITIMKSKQELISGSDETIDYIGYMGNSNPNGLIQNPSSAVDKLFNAYVEEQRKSALLDYNDLINMFLYILIKFEDKRKKWQQKFEYIMCDEFNDIDRKQYQMLKILSEYHQNLMIVGDPDQTIYSWRGSDVRYILDFANEFPNVKDIVVNVNYRSLPSILNVANSLIKNNKDRLDKDLIPNRVGNTKVIYKTLLFPYDEAKWIIEKILELKENGEDLKDIAILYRNNRIARNFEEELIKNSIDYRIYCGVDFYSRKEIKDLISYLRFILYEKDIDLERIIKVPKRGIGDSTLNTLKEYAENNQCSLYESLKTNIDNGILKRGKEKAKEFIELIEYYKQNYSNMSILDLLEDIIIKTGYQEELTRNNEQEKLENIEELKQGILEFQNTDIEEKTLQEYLDKISLFTDNDRTNKENAVKLMTIHNSKGLEFKNVFVCRINEGILPSGKVITPEAIEEERRLCYVAITRAKDRLFLSDVQNITGDYECNVSRFLLELDKEQLEFVDEQSKDRLSEIKVNNKDMAILNNMEFKVGDNIEHFVFGKGIIKQVDEENRTYGIKFENVATIRTISANIKLDKIPTNT